MANKKKDLNTEKKEEFIPIPLEWHVPEDQITPFATNMVIQVEEEIFKLSFFEMKPPIQMDKALPHPSVIRADCVASVYITPNRVGQLIELLQKHLERYKTMMKAEE